MILSHKQEGKFIKCELENHHKKAKTIKIKAKDLGFDGLVISSINVTKLENNKNNSSVKFSGVGYHSKVDMTINVINVSNHKLENIFDPIDIIGKQFLKIEVPAGVSCNFDLELHITKKNNSITYYN